MKKIGMLLSVLSLLAIATVAPAVTVNVQQNGANVATYTNATLAVGQDGTVTVTVPSSQTCATNPPTISVTGYPSTGTVGTQVSANIAVTDGNNGTIGLPSNPVTATVGTVSGGTWTWTPTSSAVQTVTLTVTNNASCNATFTFTVTVSGGSTPPPTGGATLLPSSGLGMSFGSPMVVGSLGEQHYYFTLPSAASSVTTYTTTRDWTQNVDMFVSSVSQPSCPEPSSMTKSVNIPLTGGTTPPWYAMTADSNESVYATGVFRANSTFYVTICNRSTADAKYGIYWSMR